MKATGSVTGSVTVMGLGWVKATDSETDSEKAKDLDLVKGSERGSETDLG